MKSKLLILTMVLSFYLGSCNSSNAEQFSLNNQAIIPEDIASLRGKHSIRALSKIPAKNKIIKDGDYDRNFELQPPLVPHKSDYMKITLTKNRCLDCHSNANYREQEADKMSGSHFITRDGKRLKTLSPRRYFCKQCHVSQTNAKNLIENTYVNTDE